MANKHFVGIPDTIYDTMENGKNYYLTITKDTTISVEEELIPLSVIQTYISSSQTDIANLNNRVGNLETPDYITVVRTSNVTIGTTSTTIAFDTTVSGNGITNSDGVITVNKSGLYSGFITLWINQSSNPTLWLWVEHSTDGGATWSIYRNTGSKILSNIDSQFTFQLDGNVVLNAGDKIRIRMNRSGGGGEAAVLEQQTTTIDSVSVTQYAAMLAMCKM